MAFQAFNPYDTKGAWVYPTDRRVLPFQLRGVTQIDGPNVDVTQTSHPIEQGSDITLHRHIGPRTVSFSLTLSEVGDPSDPTLYSAPSLIDAVRVPLERILKLGILCTLSWGKNKLPNMAITSLSPTHDATQQREDTWIGTVAWTETLVGSSTTTPAVNADALEDDIATTQDGGPQAGKSINGETSVQVDGILGKGY